MTKNKFRNIKKQKNNKKTIEIVIIEEKQQPTLMQNNKILYLIPLLFLLFNSNLFMFAPLILMAYTWFNKPNELIKKEEIKKEELLNKDQLDFMFILPIIFVLFILFFVFFYILFSYLRTKTSLPCIQSCDSIVNSVSSSLDISPSLNI